MRYQNPDFFHFLNFSSSLIKSAHVNIEMDGRKRAPRARIFYPNPTNRLTFDVGAAAHDFRCEDKDLPSTSFGWSRFTGPSGGWDHITKIILTQARGCDYLQNPQTSFLLRWNLYALFTRTVARITRTLDRWCMGFLSWAVDFVLVGLEDTLPRAINKYQYTGIYPSLFFLIHNNNNNNNKYWCATSEIFN